MKIEKVVFIQANCSFDLSGPIKLATFRLFIYFKMEHKVNKIYIPVESQDLTINKMHLFSQYNDHEQNSKQVNDVFFTHFELGYLLIIS